MFLQVLPRPPETVHTSLKHKPDWVDVPKGPDHIHLQRNPELSFEDLHEARGIYVT